VLANKEGYEPGDTLKLLVPFLIEAGVTEEDLRTVSAKAGLVPGIRELFSERELFSMWIISTSYRQHAFSIAKRVELSTTQVYCTEFPLNRFVERAGRKEFSLIRQVREKIVELYNKDLASGVNDVAIQELLDPFFWGTLPKTRIGRMIVKMEVMGGRRKVRALERALHDSDKHYLSEAFVVVDSINDFRMAQAVEAAGGIALAWNANWFVIPYASCGVAAVNALAVKPLLHAWRAGGRAAVKEMIETTSKSRTPKKGPYYHWLVGKDLAHLKEVLKIHKRLRIVCRGLETAKLG